MFKYLFLFVFTASLTAYGQTNSKAQSTGMTNNFAPLPKNQKMDTAYFWKIMDYGFEKGEFNNKLREQAILEQLIKLTPEQIVDFEIIFQQQVDKSNTWNNLAAQTIMEGGSSDDRFYYFRCWLISLGKLHFEETIRNPDYLAGLHIPQPRNYVYVQFEELIPLSDKAYSIVTNKANEDETFPRASAYKRGLYFDSGGETKGREWAEDELPKIAPKLYKKYSGL